MRLEIDSYDRSYILYNIGLTHTSNGKHAKALEYYFQALERNSKDSIFLMLTNLSMLCSADSILFLQATHENVRKALLIIQKFADASSSF